MKIGVYVGSFNPVHKGHMKIVNYLLDNCLDKVIIMPTSNYWDKNDLISVDNRINMLKNYESDRIIIEDTNNNLPYTYLVMRYLSEKYPDDELSLIIGADNIVNFNKWDSYKELLGYNIIIINRDNIDVKYYLNILEKSEKYLIIDELGNIDISSTAIRDLIKKNDFSILEELVDKKIIEYITQHNLYS